MIVSDYYIVTSEELRNRRPTATILQETDFGKLTLTGRILIAKTRSQDQNARRKFAPKWECRCACGNTAYATANSLKFGNTKSCGCGRSPKKHGLHKSYIYKAFHDAVSRCENPNVKQYKDYGGRGISVFQGWKDDFMSFVAYMGKRPSEKHTIDRINNNGNYEPGNVRWATTKEQARNTRRNHNITVNGTTLCITDWAKRSGLKVSMIYWRLKNGWEASVAVTTPSKKVKGLQ